MGRIRLSVSIDGYQHSFSFRLSLKNTLLIRQNHRPEISVIQSLGFPFGFRQFADPLGKLIKLRLRKARPKGRIPLSLICFCSPLASVIYTGDPRHSKAQSIDQGQMFFLTQNAGHSRHIMVIHKGKHVFSFVKGPILRTELPHQGMDDLEHIHAVKAGIQPLIALIIGSGMEHAVIDQTVIVAVKHLS